MAETSWLTIVGLGEDGPEGLGAASRDALADAEVIMGPERHLSLIPEGAARRVVWPVPFKDGLGILEGLKGRRVVVLASGDPFWFGAGRVIGKHFSADEWCAHPGVSAFSLAASRLGWPIEQTICLGLHAAPLARLRPHLCDGARLLVLVRDGDAVAEVARYLTGNGCGKTVLHVLEALGGPRERHRHFEAKDDGFDDVQHPVCLGLEIATSGLALTVASGQSDDVFENDGQITKRPVRAITMSSLAPRPGESLWDIGAGSGSIAIEWLLSSPTTEAVAIEARPERAAQVRRNADDLGQDRLHVVEGTAPMALSGLPKPDAVFIGGGLTEELLAWLWAELTPGTRIVANAVTLETTGLLSAAQARYGGDLLKIELADATPLGGYRGWKGAYPVVQWSIVR